MDQKRREDERKQTFQQILNPYTPGLPLKPGNLTFLGREDIFEFIQQSLSTLAGELVLVLTGERRTGKTSILRQLPARLKNSDYIPVYVDAQALGIDLGMRNFFFSLIEAIVDGVQEAGISTPLLTPADLGEIPQRTFEQRFLPMVRERIGNRILLLVIDEFQELEDRVSRGRLPADVFPYLRHLIQHEEQLAFIFAGTHKVEELTGDYWSVLFNVALYKRIGFLKREETVRLITEPVKPYGMAYDELAVAEILRITGCHPYLTQLLCNILVNRCNQARCNYVAVQDVRDALEELLETGRAHLNFVWHKSSREERIVMSALAKLKEQSDRATITAVATHLGERHLPLDPELIVQIAERLASRDLLQTFPGDPPTVDFTAQLYAHWLRKYKPFSLMLKEAVGQEEWERAKHLIEDLLFKTGSITLDQLTNMTEPDRQFVWSRYIDTYRSEFDFVQAPFIRFRNQKGLNSLNKAWQKMVAVLTSGGADKDLFDECAEAIIEQLQSVGFQVLPSRPLPRHPTFLTFFLDTKLAFEDTRLPPSVPLVFSRRLAIKENDVSEIRRLLHKQLRPSCNLAFVVVSSHVASRQRTEDLLRDKLAPYACDVVLLDLDELQRIIVAQDPQTALRRLVLSKVDLVSISPFITTGATSDNVFFGREPELREIYQHIATVSYAIIGGRRIGKTSLLGRLHRIRLPATGFRTIYHDCSNTPTYKTLLTTHIHNWQPEPPRDVPATFSDLLQSPPNDKSLVLLLDEADKLVPSDRSLNWQLFNALRALTSSNRAQVVFSGERTLRDALRDPTSPLFNFANEILLGPLDFRAVEELVTRPMKQLEIELVDEKAIADRIWSFTSGHPNVVQRLCRRLIERLNEQGTRRITLDDVDAVIEDPGFQRDDFLSTYWEAATSLEKIISLVMADDENVRTLRTVRQALAERCNLHPKAREVDDALQRLVDLRSILKRTPTGYEFAVEAFPRVVAGTMTLDDMLEILTEEYQEQGE